MTIPRFGRRFACAAALCLSRACRRAMAEPDEPITPDRGPRMRETTSARAKADFFYQPSTMKRGGAYVSVPPGRNSESALPWRVGVRLFEADTKTGGETFLKLHVEDGPVEKTSMSTKGRWRPWEAHTSLWVGDPATDHLVVKAYGYQVGSGAAQKQIGTPFKIPLAPFAWSRESGARMPAPADHDIPSSDGGRVRMQLVCVQAPSAHDSPKLEVLVGTWNVGNEPPPPDLRSWLDVGAVDRPAMPPPPPERHREMAAGDDLDADGSATPNATPQGTPPTPESAGRATKKANEKLYAQPPPPDMLLEKQGVCPTKFGAFAFVVVGCQEGDYAPRSGFENCESDWLACLAGTLGDSYVLLSKRALGQMRVAAFVRADVAPATHRWRSCTEATGIGHVLSNKGGVGVSCRVWDTSLCFINSHLAAHDDMERRRNDDFAEIVRGCAFGEKVECVQAFHHLVWFGDLNYRCEWGLPETASAAKRVDRNPPKERVRRMIEALSAEAEDAEKNENAENEKRRKGARRKADAPADPVAERHAAHPSNVARRLAVFETDQLTAARKRGDAFMGFEEGNPAEAHMPTFKVQRQRGFAYKEQRTPAWCDRVLWKTAEGFRCDLSFLRAAGEVGTSDHKPVSAGLSVELCAHAAVMHFEEESPAEVRGTPRAGGAGAGALASHRSARSRSGSDAGSVADSSFSKMSSEWSSVRGESEPSPGSRAFKEEESSPFDNSALFRERDKAKVASAGRRVTKTVPGLPAVWKRRHSEKRKTWFHGLFFSCLCPSADSYDETEHCGWQLRFNMLQGKNLLPADINGYSDPYVTFFGSLLAAPPASGAAGKPARWRTKTIVANLDPKWRCDAQVPAIPLLSADPAVIAKEHLLFRVMDEDTLTMDDPIGYGRLHLGPLAEALTLGESVSMDTKVPLTQFGRVAGELQVIVTLERVPWKTKSTKVDVSARKAARKKAAAEGKPNHYQMRDPETER